MGHSVTEIPYLNLLGLEGLIQMYCSEFIFISGERGHCNLFQEELLYILHSVAAYQSLLLM
jgi:hypothetical protein